MLHLHARTPIHIRLLRSHRRHFLIQPHSLPSLQGNRHDIAPRLLLIHSIHQQSLLLHLTLSSFPHILQLFLSLYRQQHLSQRHQRRQHQHNRHVRIELIAQELNRLHLPQQRRQRNGPHLRFIQLQQHHKVITQRELDSTHILRIERQRVHIRMAIIQSVRVHERDSEQKPRPKEANKQVHEGHARKQNTEKHAVFEPTQRKPDQRKARVAFLKDDRRHLRDEHAHRQDRGQNRQDLWNGRNPPDFTESTK